jgi:hypothetical protein
MASGSLQDIRANFVNSDEIIDLADDDDHHDDDDAAKGNNNELQLISSTKQNQKNEKKISPPESTQSQLEYLSKLRRKTEKRKGDEVSVAQDSPPPSPPTTPHPTWQ